MGGAGAACDSVRQCDYGMLCTSDGVYADPTVVGAGEACDPEAGVFCSLAEGLSCAVDMANETRLTCEPFRQLDESCMEEGPQAQTSVYYACDPMAHLYCDIDFQSYTGVCAAQKIEGSPCEQDEECLSGWCNGNGVCNTYSNARCGSDVEPE